MRRRCLVAVAAMCVAVIACGCRCKTRAPEQEKSSYPFVSTPETRAAALRTVLPEEAEETLVGGSPEEIASLHYRAIIYGQKETWLKTLTEDNRQTVSVKDGVAKDWWIAGRHCAQDLNIYWEYMSTVDKLPDPQNPTHVKVMFYRRNADGTQRGNSASMELVIERGCWRVERASY